MTRRFRTAKKASIGADLGLFNFQDHLHLQELINVKHAHTHTHNISLKLYLDKPSLDVISCSSITVDNIVYHRLQALFLSDTILLPPVFITLYFTYVQ